jgi:hypothetical protein
LIGFVDGESGRGRTRSSTSAPIGSPRYLIAAW